MHLNLAACKFNQIWLNLIRFNCLPCPTNFLTTVSHFGRPRPQKWRLFHTSDVHLTTVSRFGRPLDDSFTFRRSTWRQFHVSDARGPVFWKKMSKNKVPQNFLIILTPGEGHSQATLYSKWRLFCHQFSLGYSPFVMVNEYDSFEERYPSWHFGTLFRSVCWQLFLQTGIFISWF